MSSAVSQTTSSDVPAVPSELLTAADSWSAEQTLQWAFNRYGQEIAIASGLGPEGIVVLDISAKTYPNVLVFMLDTGYLFPQTLELASKLEARYHITIERISPKISPAQQAEQLGPELWNNDPDRCCQLRKIEPLKAKLRDLCAWITGIRHDQTPARRSARKIQWDANFNLVKINPLVDWTHEMVWRYIRAHHLDYNPLHDDGYLSIGCVQCTRPVRAGENPRSGRWPGFTKTECGLHIIDGSG